MSRHKFYYTPKSFTKDLIHVFLLEVQNVFSAQNKRIENVVLQLSRTRKIDIIGILLLYKFMDYTLKHNVFFKPIIIIEKTYIESVVGDFGCKDLLYSLIRNNKPKEKDYRTLTLETHNNFIIAPHALLKTEDINHSLSTQYMPNIKMYYGNDRVVSMIFHCFSETVLNFWAHAVGDDQSIIMAKGNSSGIEIACIDNGCGIISSLKHIYPHISKEKILKLAFDKNVSSKPQSNHMGCGLWLIKEICLKAGGCLMVYSEGVKAEFNQRKISFEQSAYWRGTIFYLYLPTNNPVTPADILTKNTSLTEIFD